MSSLKQIRRELAQARRDLIARQKEQLRQLKEKQEEERYSLHLDARMKAAALFADRLLAKEQKRLAREEKIRAAEARLAAWRAEKEATEKLTAAAEALKALGFTVEVKMERPAPPAAPEGPKRPLSWWQHMIKDTGKLLSDAGVELLPGSPQGRDVRLLAVFCHFLRKLARDRGCIPLTHEQILGLARQWRLVGGRQFLATEGQRQAWWVAAGC
jgi:hypothetical protein